MQFPIMKSLLLKGLASQSAQPRLFTLADCQLFILIFMAAQEKSCVVLQGAHICNLEATHTLQGDMAKTQSGDLWSWLTDVK